MIPTWILDVFAAVVLVVAALSVGRIAAAWPWRHGAAVTEADVAYPLMGIAMAGTLAASLRILPDSAWEVIFAALTVLFAYQVVEDAGESGVRPVAGVLRAPQRVQSAAILYMFVSLAMPATGRAAMRTLHYPTIAFVFAVVLAGCSVWDLDQLSRPRYSRARAGAALAYTTQPGSLAPAVAAPAATALPGSLAAGAHAIAQARPRSAEAERAVPDRDRTSPKTTAVRGFLLLPQITVGCRVAMGVTMSFMLLIMI
jgi:hypothetical protein